MEDDEVRRRIESRLKTLDSMFMLLDPVQKRCLNCAHFLRNKRFLTRLLYRVKMGNNACLVINKLPAIVRNPEEGCELWESKK